MKKVTKQARNVERTFKTMRAVQRNPTSHPGQHSGCWSEARTPSEAAMNSPANGARWRNDNNAVDPKSDKIQHYCTMLLEVQILKLIKIAYRPGLLKRTAPWLAKAGAFAYLPSKSGTFRLKRHSKPVVRQDRQCLWQILSRVSYD